jgi:hypothetical protein
MKKTDYAAYYTLVLGVLQNSGFLVADMERGEDRAFLKGIPRSHSGSGIEIELRRRKPKGVDVHILVVPHEDISQEPGRFLMKAGAFTFLQTDTTSTKTLEGMLPALQRDETERRVDPRFARTPTNVPKWIFFNLRGGRVTWFLGTVVGTLAAAYLVFWAPDGEYRFNSALIGSLLLILAPWWSGIWARSAARGFVAGFMTVLIPAVVYVISALGWALPGLRRDPGVWTIDMLMGSLEGSLGLIAPVLLGLLAAMPGAIAGVVGGRIFPTRMRRAKSSEPA